MNTVPELNILDILMKYDLLGEKDAVSVKMESLSTGRDIKELVFEKGLVSEDALFYALSTELNLPFVAPSADTVDHKLVRSVPRDLLEKYRFLPLAELDNEVKVAVTDPSLNEVMEVINRTFPIKTVSISMALPSVILDTIDAVFTGKNMPPVASSSPAISIFYSALTKAVLKSSAMLYFEAVNSQLRVRNRVKDRLSDPELHPVDYMEPVIKKIKEMFSIAKGPSGSIKTRISGREVFITSEIITADKNQGAILRFRYPSKKMTLDKFHIPDEYAGILQKALSENNGLILVTGKNKELRESFSRALLLESNPAKQKVIALFQEEDTLPDTESYITTNTESLDSVVSSLMDAGINKLYIQDIRKEDINILNILQLAENTLVIASISTPSAKDAISFIERKTPELSKENRCISAVVETHKNPISCQHCSSASHAASGKGCRRCGFSGISGYSEKIDVLGY